VNPALPIQELFAGSSVPVLSAFLLGLLVAVSPCPLTTNIAALAYIGRSATEPVVVFYSGALYTLGRMASYTLLIAFLVLVGIEASGLAGPLQDVGQYLLGPLLVLTGLVVLGVVPFSLPARLGVWVGAGEKLAERGPLGAFGLGAIFALAFCPYSAALFFGVLLPLALSSSGGVALAPAFALGTGLPVLVAALALSAGVTRLADWFEVTTRVEPVLRWAAGLTFVGVGFYSISLWLWAQG
jgi:cytochrome c-type biogenesis protein